MNIDTAWLRVSNHEVAKHWAMGISGRSHTGNLYTDGTKIYSYALQIGDTSPTGVKFVRDYTANGSYGFRSMTTSKHVGMLRYIHGVDQQPVVV